MALTIPRNYGDGNTLTEAMLDAAFDAVEEKFNTTLIQAADIAAGAVGNSALASSAVDNTKIASPWGLLPTGTIIDYAGSSTPSGFLDCDGSAVSRTTYSALFTALSTTWGAGDGSTTFNLPDLRGRTGIGAGTGSGLTARTLGTNVGAETLPAHTHGVNITSGNQSANHTHSGTTDSGGTHSHNLNVARNGTDNGAYEGFDQDSSINDSASGLNCGVTTADGAHTHTFTTGNQSANHTHTVSGTSDSTGTGSHGVMQPSAVVRKLIKT